MHVRTRSCRGHGPLMEFLEKLDKMIFTSCYQEAGYLGNNVVSSNASSAVEGPSLVGKQSHLSLFWYKI
jgi:hypothetical protein